MLKVQRTRVEEAVDELSDLLEKPWSLKYTTIEKLRVARSKINLTLKDIRKRGVGRK